MINIMKPNKQSYEMIFIALNAYNFCKMTLKTIIQRSFWFYIH